MAITVSTSGSFENTESFFKRMSKSKIGRVLESYGAMGTAALAAATPMETGLTASSWRHEVSREGSGWQLSWHNQNGSQGYKIAILLQYGHGTGTGGYVAGRDYINPAIQPIFDKIATEVWREVTRP